ncbi:MAG: tRNA (guanosine(37)-N1)-methyltransferase TrmD [Desulfobacteraceae bacterium]|nr:MAG: tRNA (guanosine(37)-N1)-methyltransferase TrmD [Desulfobacteraceae bacterium]
MVIDILTLSPSYFASPLQEGMIHRGIEKGLVRVRIFNLREFALDRHRTVDDRPFGGGPGMVLKPDPIVRALNFLQGIPPRRPYSILLTPRGRPLDQRILKKIAAQGRLILICGRYEGVDERVGAYYCRDQISIGDYVLSGGEPAALVMLDGVVRLIPEVLGSSESIDQESHEDYLLEYPQYTRPGNFENHKVPDILLNGNHEQIRRWRRQESLSGTRAVRPELLDKAILNEEDLVFLALTKEASQKRPDHRKRKH